MQIITFSHRQLTIDKLVIEPSERWCFYGSGRSGINAFLLLLENRLADWQAELADLPVAPTVISFGAQQDIFEDELRNDDSDFLDHPDPGTLAREFLPPGTLDSPLIDQFAMRPHLDTGYRQLSSGQSRKLLLLQALLGGAETVVIDSPYDGLDRQSCLELDRAFGLLVHKALRLLVLVRNVEDIPSWCDRLAVFSRGALASAGRRQDVLPGIAHLADLADHLFQSSPADVGLPRSEPLPRELVRLAGGFARYGEKEVFTGLELTIAQGQHTLVTGPNGCGKSTLLQIITGDNPKCYANDLTIFGHRRGSGESIWEIKRYMGIVSPEIHRSYRVPGSALQVVLSGLFDSIGLYRPVTPPQRRLAADWLEAVDLADLADVPFRRLTYGDQRLVLIARALIKQPPLLILDEPTQGLDSSARKSLLDFLETISRGNTTTILYVSHRQDEFRSFFRQHLRL